MDGSGVSPAGHTSLAVLPYGDTPLDKVVIEQLCVGKYGGVKAWWSQYGTMRDQCAYAMTATTHHASSPVHIQVAANVKAACSATLCYTLSTSDILSQAALLSFVLSTESGLAVPAAKAVAQEAAAAGSGQLWCRRAADGKPILEMIFTGDAFKPFPGGKAQYTELAIRVDPRGNPVLATYANSPKAFVMVGMFRGEALHLHTLGSSPHCFI